MQGIIRRVLCLEKVHLKKYTQKVNDFISCGNFTTANACITKNLQRELRDTMNECRSIIQKDDKWKLMNTNPTAPTMRGLIKVHKEGAPIRPVINWRNALGYKLAKMLVKVLSSHTPLPFTYNVKNTVQLMDDLLKIPQGHLMKFASFDISNMYSNIPTGELIAIVSDSCIKNNVD